MYKIYFKQAIQMLKQNKFISIITITGTALAIMMIMTIIVTQQIQLANLAPEVNRDRTLYISTQILRNEEWNSMNSNALNSKIYKDYLSEMSTPERMSLLMTQGFAVKSPENKNWKQLKVKLVDNAFWEIMSFNLLEGRVFTKEEFDSGIRKTIITDKTAKELFGKKPALNQMIEVDFEEYQVIGIIKDVPQSFEFSQADLYVPYTILNNYDDFAGYSLLILASGLEDFKAIEGEVREAEVKYNTSHTEKLTLLGPYSHITQKMGTGGYWEEVELNAGKQKKKLILTLLILLIVPAINLSGFSMSQIKKRTEEIGIRKAFGAKKYIILIQVLYENFITSLVGGIIGLILSFLVVSQLKNWLLNVGSKSSLPLEALLSPTVFLAVFVVCLLLNLLSAGIPAYRASRMKIVDSLNQNKK